MTASNSPSPAQKEKAQHGETLFPLQRYITILSDSYPAVTAHWHEEAEFTRIIRGTCIYQIQSETYEAHPGDLLFIPPLALHSITVANQTMESETYVFHMNLLGAGLLDAGAIRYLTPLMHQKLIPPFLIPCPHPVYPAAQHLFTSISNAYLQTPAGYELLLKAYFLQLVACLLPYCTKASAQPPMEQEHTRKIKSVLAYIDRHYSENLTVPELAASCYFSEYYFMRVFKKYVGMSCLDYIKNVRLQKAAEAFSEGEISPMEAALNAGFHNLSYFYREFRKKFGMTPGEFIRQPHDTLPEVQSCLRQSFLSSFISQ